MNSPVLQQRQVPVIIPHSNNLTWAASLRFSAGYMEANAEAVTWRVIAMMSEGSPDSCDVAETALKVAESLGTQLLSKPSKFFCERWKVFFCDKKLCSQ